LAADKATSNAVVLPSASPHRATFIDSLNHSDDDSVTETTEVPRGDASDVIAEFVEPPRSNKKPQHHFRRSGRGRLKRHPLFVPTLPKPQPPSERSIPLARHAAGRTKAPNSALDQPVIARLATAGIGPYRAQQAAFQLREERPDPSHPRANGMLGSGPIARAGTAKLLSSFVDSKQLPLATAASRPDEPIDREESIPSSLTSHILVNEFQPPEASDSPSDFERLVAPRNDESPEGVADIATEEVSPTQLDPYSRPIAELGTSIDAPGGEFPGSAAADPFAAAGQLAHPMGARRRDVETVVFWDAPAVSHRPLYFEDVNLERHGFKVPLVQPVLSAAHFFGRLPTLPYLMVAEKHRQQRYTLGHYRPGSAASYAWYLPRPSIAGGVVGAAAVTGVLFAFP